MPSYDLIPRSVHIKERLRIKISGRSRLCHELLQSSTQSLKLLW